MVSKLPWWQILGVLAGVLGLSEAGRVQLGLVSNWEQFHRPQALLVSFSPIPLPHRCCTAHVLLRIIIIIIIISGGGTGGGDSEMFTIGGGGRLQPQCAASL